MLASQQFCVKWNSYSSNLQSVFPRLLSSEHFVDLTLACEGQMIKCHKVVLSACSTYFEKLLVHNPCQHPIIFMKGMKHWEVQALVDFMYKGEVNVSQDELNSLLEAAEALQIRGLCGSDQSAALPARSALSQDGTVDRETPPAKRPRDAGDDVESACDKKVIKQEPDGDDNFVEGEMDGDGPDEHYANHEPQEDSDSKDTPASPLDIAGPSGLSTSSSNQPGDKSGVAPWLPKVRPYRQYTNDNLWAALMDVKGGGSVYRASKQHGIPRKTLRNWMKRWNIQSAFSTPARRGCRSRAPPHSSQPRGVTIAPATPQVFAQPVAATLRRTPSTSHHGVTIAPAAPALLVRPRF